MYVLKHIFMSDTPPPEQPSEPTLTSLLASICAANRPGRVLMLTDPVRTHGFNALQRAYIYAILDRSGIMRIIGSTRCKLSVRLSCYRSSLKTQHTSSPLFRYMEETGQDFSGWTIIPLKTLYYDAMHCAHRVQEEELKSIDYYCTRGAPLLNKNRPLDINDSRRVYQQQWRMRNGQGVRDAQGRSLSYSAQYCRQWRANRAAARAAAAAAA